MKHLIYALLLSLNIGPNPYADSNLNEISTSMTRCFSNAFSSMKACFPYQNPDPIKPAETDEGFLDITPQYMQQCEEEERTFAGEVDDAEKFQIISTAYVQRLTAENPPPLTHLQRIYNLTHKAINTNNMRTYLPLIRDYAQPTASTLVVLATLSPKFSSVGGTAAILLPLLKDLKSILDRWEKTKPLK